MMIAFNPEFWNIEFARHFPGVDMKCDCENKSITLVPNLDGTQTLITTCHVCGITYTEII